MNEIDIGYLPLTDAASLIAAVDFGFAEDEGLVLNLMREVSWANVRDRMMVGQIQAAHMLAPMAVATTLGIGHIRYDLTAPFILSLNGNAITVSPDLADEMLVQNSHALNTMAASAAALGKIASKRRSRQLTFAVVFPFSTHHYLLRRFLMSGGLDPDMDVEIVVLPPSYMVESLSKGLIDGFCAGSPWNSVAVDQGKGVILALGSEICPRAPEKVLALPENSPLLKNEAHQKLLRALVRAARFVGEANNQDRIAKALSRADRLNSDERIILRTLRGDILLDQMQRKRNDPEFVVLSGAGVNRPLPEHGRWLYGEMLNARQIEPRNQSLAIARDVFATDIFDRAMAGETVL